MLVALRSEIGGTVVLSSRFLLDQKRRVTDLPFCHRATDSGFNNRGSGACEQPGEDGGVHGHGKHAQPTLATCGCGIELCKQWKKVPSAVLPDAR